MASSFSITTTDGRISCPECGDNDMQVIQSRIEVKEGKVTKKRKGDSIRISEGGKESSIVLDCFCRTCSTDTNPNTGDVEINYRTLKTTHQDGKLFMRWE